MGVFDEIVKEVEKISVCEDELQLRGIFTPITPKSTEQTIICIDGGSGILLSAPNYCVAFIRLYACFYSGKKRMKSEKKEFYTVVSIEDNKYHVRFLNSAKPELFIDIEEKTIPENMVDLIRKTAELEFAKELAKDQLIILDGDLEAEHELEKKAFDELHEHNNIAAVSKTNRFVKEGGSIIGALFKSGPKDRWLYQLNSKTAFVKLHRNSNYLFRLDSKSEHKEIAEILSTLSSDPVFIGYPYPLVEADARARVTKKECEIMRLQISARLKRSDSIRALDAHSVLDALNSP